MRRLLVVVLFLAACSGNAAVPTVVPTTPTAIPTTTVVAPGTTVPTTLVSSMTTIAATTTVTSPPPTEAPPTTPPSSVPDQREGWFVVSVTGWLPEGFADALRAVPGVAVVSEVWVGNAPVVETRTKNGDLVDATKPGFVLPIELHAISPSEHADFVPNDVATALEDLAPEEVLLGTTSARFRRLGVGGTVMLESGATLVVAGIVDDRWVGFAEMVTTAPDAVSMGADRPRYAVVQFQGRSQGLVEAAAGLTDRAVRVWGEDEVPVFRHADAVPPQIRIKERFGEFSYRPRGGQRVDIDPDWVEANIVTVELPLIGSMRCHAAFVEMLRDVMERLEADGNGAIISRGSNDGCFHPRFIAGRRDLSRHSWGSAADINWGHDFDSRLSPVAPPLLEAMMDAGITSGHDWMNPDPGHFEWGGER